MYNFNTILCVILALNCLLYYLFLKKNFNTAIEREMANVTFLKQTALNLNKEYKTLSDI